MSDNEREEPLCVDLRDRIELRIDGNNVVCDWGVITNPDGDPALPVGPLMIVTALTVRELLSGGAAADQWNNINSVKETDGGVFFTAERGRQRWTWKLFPAYCWDDETYKREPHLYVGRWMD